MFCEYLRKVRVVCVLFGGLFGAVDASPALASPQTCYGAAQKAADQSGVPVDILLAITLNETGRQRAGEIEPWPWTMNVAGKGYWFDNQAEAKAFAKRQLDRGQVSFDVGCFQINYRWHKSGFAGIDAMFDPVENALYAAKFLSALHAETGSWLEAAGAYHSRTPKYAARYRKRFASHLTRIRNRGAKSYRMASVEPVASDPPTSKPNGYSLLQTGPATGMGSLVPLSNEAPSRFVAGF